MSTPNTPHLPLMTQTLVLLLLLSVGGLADAAPPLTIDYETGSLWAAISREALSGPAEGRLLERVPSGQKTAWGAWARMHPDTTLGTVIPLDLRGRQRGYPFSLFRGAKGISDVLDDVPPLVDRNEAAQHAGVFSRLVGVDAELQPRFGDLATESFHRDTRDRITDTDLKTRTAWDVRTGEVFADRLEGIRLEPEPFENTYRFVWVDDYPKTSLRRWPRIGLGTRNAADEEDGGANRCSSQRSIGSLDDDDC